MNRDFHYIDIESWSRRDEYDYFSQGPCGYTMTSNVDVTNLYEYVKRNEFKLYPVLVAVMSRIVNEHDEFKYALKDGRLGKYDVLHPMFYDMRPSGDTQCLCAEYRYDIAEQLKEIERVRKRYEGVDAYLPQGTEIPPNSLNISCVPWEHFSSVSISLKYVDYYYTPIIVFGKFEITDGRRIIPISITCNHAVNDGRHITRLFREFREFSDRL